MLLVKLLWPVAGVLISAVLLVANWLVEFIFGINVIGLAGLLLALFLKLAVVVGILALLVPGFRRRLPAIARATYRLLIHLWKLAVPVARITFRLLKALVQGTNHEKTNANENKNTRSLRS